MKENMYYGASPVIFKRAEELRNAMTAAEDILWQQLHINAWKLKFRRQHPISNYIVDFYCHALKLVVEVDGGIHDVEEVKRFDETRESALQDLGLTVMRFKNEDVFKNSNAVLKKIGETISVLQSAPLGDGGKLFVIKIGGNVLDDAASCMSFLKTFAALKGAKILVHGGGKLATKLAEQLGVQQQLVEGRRITDAETLKIITMVYAGLINKTVVAQLQAAGCNAIGLSGADGNVIKAHKRVQATLDYGFVGDVDEVNAPLLQTLLQQNTTPVLCAVSHDGAGQLLNTNADTIAQETAKALASFFDVELIYTFEKAGVLQNVADEASIIPKISAANYTILKESGAIFAGMIPKLDNAFAALNAGVARVCIGKAEQLETLVTGVSGTSIVHE